MKTKVLISCTVRYCAADLCLCFHIYIYAKISFLMTWLIKGVIYSISMVNTNCITIGKVGIDLKLYEWNW